MHPRIAALVLCCLLLTVRAAGGQELTENNRLLAKSLVDDALAALERKEYRKAQVQLESAYRIYPSDKIQYTLGNVYEMQENWLAAIEAYQRFLSGVPDDQRRADRSTGASAAIARLSARVGRLSCEGEPGAWLQVDDAPRRTLSAGTEVVWVAPGAHRVRWAGGDQTVSVAAGESATVRLLPPAAGPPRPPAGPASSGVPLVTPPAGTVPGGAGGAALGGGERQVGRPFRAAKWVAGALAVAGIAAGAVLFALDGVEGAPGDARDIGAAVLAAGGGAAGLSGLMFGLDYFQARDAQQGARTALLHIGRRF